jgi:hypothetical protein
MLAEALARRLADVLRERLPPKWRTTWRSEVAVGHGVLDAVIDIVAPDGRGAQLVLEAKARLEPKDVPAAVAQARRYAQAVHDNGNRGDAGGSGTLGSVAVVVGSSYLSPRTRQLLAAEGAGYVDLTDNLRVAADDPPLFIELPGRDTNPWSDNRPLRSLRGAAAARVVRALCDFRTPYGVQELAARSQTPIGTVSRVVSLLDSEAVLTREHRGAVTEVRWADLIRRWTQDYAFAASNRVSPYLEPRGLPALLQKLEHLSSRYALTGPLAATDLAPIAAPRLAALYTDAFPDETAAALGLRLAETGANVLLAVPYDPVVFDRTRSRGALVCAAPSQVAADLLTGPGRSPSEGEALLEWMREHEDAWRR